MSNYNHAEAHAYREQRAAAHAVAVRCLRDEHPSVEVRSTYEKAMAEVERLNAKISGLEENRGKFAPKLDAKLEMAFGRYLRYGKGSLDASEQRMLERRDLAEGTPMLTHVGAYSGLGYFVPTGFTDIIEQATKFYAPLLNGSCIKVIDTDSGQPLPFPVSNDTAEVASIVGEAANVSELDVQSVSQVVLGSYKFTSGLVKVSSESMQDSAFDLETWLGDLFGQRFGRAMEQYLTTGSGSSQPTGLLTAIEASGASPVIAAGSSPNDGIVGNTGANSIGSQDLVNLEHSVDPSYRRGAQYMFSDGTLGTLQRILDKFGRPLWTPGVANNAPNMINGYSYTLNQSMPAIAAGANTVIFGDFTKFVARRVKAMSVKRLDELFAQTDQVGFLAFSRIDSNLVLAVNNSPCAINVLEQHS